jgi:hypothetical protein
VAVDLGAISEALFVQVMAPLVLGGAVKPPHAIGARVALRLGEAERLPVDIDLASRVQMARVRRARRLVAVDRLGPATGAEWALVAGVSDILQAANPTFDAALRRSAATRILTVAVAGIDRVAPPSTPKEALSRHTWLARVLDVARTDTTVSWWVGSRTYFGVEPPARLRAWPSVRRVSVTARPIPLLELAPLAFDRERLVEAVARILDRSPLTDLATCNRLTPPFAWTPEVLSLVSTRAGRTLGLRALARLPAPEADAALGRATRDLLRRLAGPESAPAANAPQRRGLEGVVVAGLLAERAVATAQAGEPGSPGTWPEDVAFARAIGAAMARPAIASGGIWSMEQRQSLLASLDRILSSTHGEQAAAALGAAGLNQ